MGKAPKRGRRWHEASVYWGCYQDERGRFLVPEVWHPFNRKRRPKGKRKTLKIGPNLSHVTIIMGDARPAEPAPEGMVFVDRFTTVAGYGELWLQDLLAEVDRGEAEPGDLEQAIEVFLGWVLPKLGERPVVKVTRPVMREWVAWAEERAREQTEGWGLLRARPVSDVWAVMRRLFTAASEEFHIPNPTEKVRPPKPPS